MMNELITIDKVAVTSRKQIPDSEAAAFDHTLLLPCGKSTNAWRHSYFWRRTPSKIEGFFRYDPICIHKRSSLALYLFSGAGRLHSSLA